ncbi:MAG: ABC transporter permease [Clostridia bacterium]|nr:ABC transporter permease [Clostridia bacterium]
MKNDVKVKEKKTHEPLIHITKRAALPLSQAILIRVVAILASLLFCGVITIFVTGDNPFSVYATIFDGAFGTSVRIWRTLLETAMLLAVALALTTAFKMRFWNIGGEGQILIGALATAVCMFYIGNSVPRWALILIMLVTALIAGAVWGLLPAFFKAHFGTNETLFTLMMNYVSIQLVRFFLNVADKSGQSTIGPTELTHGWLPEIIHPYFLSILVVAVLTVVIYIYLKDTKHGYEISVVGESENTARYIGINVKKVMLRTMAISGAICALVGFLLVGGTHHGITTSTADSRGFTAIMVSWLAHFNPFMMVLTSALIIFMAHGAEEVSSVFGLNASFADILTGIILFFIIGCEFFVNYQLHVNRKKKNLADEAKEVA